MTESDLRRVRLLDVDPDLGADLDPASLEQAARFTRLVSVELAAGRWNPEVLSQHAEAQGRVIGCVVMSGLITRDVSLGDRVCTHIYGPRDLVSLNSLDVDSLPFEVEFSALSPAEVLLLDDRFLAAGQRWPRIMGRMFDAATSQIGRQSADQAIAQLPRVEDRLLALFWHLADRWGTRQRDEIAIALPLTHEALGRLIGARRPTVSLGLRALGEEGAVRRDNGNWLLSPASLGRLGGDAPARVRAPSRPRLMAVPTPAATNGDGHGGVMHERLRARIDALRVQVEVGQSKVALTMDANREIREAVERSRARRAAALKRAESA